MEAMDTTNMEDRLNIPITSTKEYQDVICKHKRVTLNYFGSGGYCHDCKKEVEVKNAK